MALAFAVGLSGYGAAEGLPAEKNALRATSFASQADGAVRPATPAVAVRTAPASVVPAAVRVSPAEASPARVVAARAEPTAADAPEALPDETGETAADALSILRRAEKAYDAIRSLEADFTQDLTVPLLESTRRSRGKLYVRRPDRFLMKFSDPAGDIVVADGRYLWMYYPSTDAKQVVRASIADAGQTVDLQKEFLSDPTARFNAVLGKTEAVGGRPASILTLTPKKASPYRRVRIWVDSKDALVRRFEITEQNESLRRLELRNLRANGAVPDQLFRFTPPPGAQVFTQ